MPVSEIVGQRRIGIAKTFRLSLAFVFNTEPVVQVPGEFQVA